MERNVLLQGDALSLLKTLSDASIQCCITSPPYYALRDYQTEPLLWDADPSCTHEWETILQKDDHGDNGMNGSGLKGGLETQGQTRFEKRSAFCLRCGAWHGSLGLEPTPDLYISHLVQIFREVHRVLRKDGTLWVVIADSYAGSWGNYAPGGIKGIQRKRTEEGERWDRRAYSDTTFLPPSAKSSSMGLKDKDLIGIPWMLAFALRADGWYLRQDLIWNKPACMPESVLDRCTKSHEYIFLLAKSERYYYDTETIKEPARNWGTRDRSHFRNGTNDPFLKHHGLTDSNSEATGRNKRSVWTVNPHPYKEAHFATFPPKLVEPMILAGSSPRACEQCGAPWKRVIEPTGHMNHREAAHVPNNTPTKVDSTGWAPTRIATANFQPTCSCKMNTGTGKCVVLDPFAGAGTTLLGASQFERDWVGIELNPTYVKLIQKRIAEVQPVLWLE